ncbi:MAG: Colicin V production protein [Sporanaerobacter sp.]|uniref:CvpA family protein n=1 Tax=Sporanaerobacter sp. TaxID=2010183 RepID=UPI003A100963
MNWIDFLIVLMLVDNIVKGVSRGLVKSIFGLIKILLSIYFTKMYYDIVYGYILNTEVVYNGFKAVILGILKAVFYRKIKNDVNFLPRILASGIINVLINIFSILITYFVFRWLLGLLEELLSFLFKAPILKQLNGIGGFLFGAIKGILVIYIVIALFSPIKIIFPQGFISKAMENSLLFTYFNNASLKFNLFKIENFI